MIRPPWQPIASVGLTANVGIGVIVAATIVTVGVRLAAGLGVALAAIAFVGLAGGSGVKDRGNVGLGVTVAVGAAGQIVP